MKVTKRYCDRCKKELSEYRYWLFKPRFAIAREIAWYSKDKLELCRSCYEEAMDFFHGWGVKTPKPLSPDTHPTSPGNRPEQETKFPFTRWVHESDDINHRPEQTS